MITEDEFRAALHERAGRTFDGMPAPAPVLPALRRRRRRRNMVTSASAVALATAAVVTVPLLLMPHTAPARVTTPGSSPTPATPTDTVSTDWNSSYGVRPAPMPCVVGTVSATSQATLGPNETVPAGCIPVWIVKPG